jgi:hypothetical protein
MARALALSPDARYQTAGEFQEALARCAHRHGLLMSAPELAAELIDACGPFEQWRDDGDDDDLGYVRRAGTEVYDAGDDEDDELDAPVALIAPVALDNVAALRANGKLARSPTASGAMNRPKTEIGKLQGVELTSIINMMDLEGAPAGSRPLVDVGGGPPPSLAPGPLPPMRTVAAMPPPMAGTQQMSAPAPASVAPRPMAAARPPPPGGMLVTIDSTPATVRTRDSTALVEGRRAASSPAPRKRGGMRTWLLVVLVLVAAAIAGVLVALSGPDVPVKHAHPSSK